MLRHWKVGKEDDKTRVKSIKRLEILSWFEEEGKEIERREEAIQKVIQKEEEEEKRRQEGDGCSEEKPPPYATHHGQQTHRKLYPNVTQMVVQENDGKWTKIEGTITGRVKLCGEEDGVESASHLDSTTEDQDAPITAKRKLQLKELREESNNYLKEIGLSTSTPSAPEESEVEEECQSNNPRNEKHSTEQGRWRELSEEEDTRIWTTPDNSGERNTSGLVEKDTRIRTTPDNSGERNTSGLVERRVKGTLYIEPEATALRRKEDQQLHEELVKSLDRLEQQLKRTEEIDAYAKRTLERSTAEMEERMRQIVDVIQQEDDNPAELEKKENRRRWESNWPSNGRRKGRGKEKPESTQQRKSGRMVRAPRRFGTEEDLPAIVMEEPEVSQCRLIAKGGEVRYVPWSFMDMTGLANQLPDICQGGQKWITKFEEKNNWPPAGNRRYQGHTGPSDRES
ncbi:hypothetical protein Q7C36_006927 [Tachysurus vachellii]|uniref:Uncharacterized protein n=1 Tax=Tachysurus vachellii TaxID=175792 RepID=A0AA88NB54_TACVA|nr:hypothetical protein Q7C36_006927 [Tachysurus vachellii]